MRFLLIFAIFFAAPIHAQVSQNILLTDDAFIGKEPGPDGLWNTSDDTAVAAHNTIGAASGFANSDGTFGFWQGTIESQLILPDFEIVSLNYTGESSCTVCLGTNFALSATLANDGPFFGTITGPNSLITSVRTNVTSISGTELIETKTAGHPNDIGAGLFIFNGQDPEVIFAGNQDVIDHFSFILPIVNGLGIDWVTITTDRQTVDFIGGPRDSVTGIQSYTVVQLAPVPVPASLPLFICGLLLISRKVKSLPLKAIQPNPQSNAVAPTHGVGHLALFAGRFDSLHRGKH